MRMLIIFPVFVIEIFCSSGKETQIIFPTKIGEIPLPPGYERVNVSSTSFKEYLRNVPLKQNKTVYLYNGAKKFNQSAQYAVINISIGDKNLQQCADAVMRLRAEYLKSINKTICFTDNNGKKYDWNNYKSRGWQSYLETVFGMCGTLSLEKQLHIQSWDHLCAGNVLIKGGSPGHAVLVVDMAKNKVTGKYIFLIAQSYMPAQDIHVLRNPADQSLSPWYEIPDKGIIQTPEWTFYENQLRGW